MPSDAALYRAVLPEAAWGAEAYLLAAIHDDLRLLAWSMAGAKRSRKPKPTRTPATDAEASRRARPVPRAEMEHVADLLGIPKDRR